MQYGVIEDSDLERFEKRVNEQIALGWEPIGGVSVSVWTETRRAYDSYEETQFGYAQALVMP